MLSLVIPTVLLHSFCIIPRFKTGGKLSFKFFFREFGLMCITVAIGVLNIRLLQPQSDLLNRAPKQIGFNTIIVNFITYNEVRVESQWYEFMEPNYEAKFD